MAKRVVQYRAHLYQSEDNALSVTGSTSGTPITITTASAHGFSNGDIVRVDRVQTNTNANGVWSISNASGSTFTLDGSAGNGSGGATGTARKAAVTFSEADFLGEPPELPTPSVRFSEARTEGTRMTLVVSDVGNQISEEINDAQGRLTIRSRIVDIETNVDSAGWGVSYTGRVAGIMLDSSVGAYRIEVSDERWVERQSEIFAGTFTPTSQLFPCGLAVNWGPASANIPTAERARGDITDVLGTNEYLIEMVGGSVGGSSRVVPDSVKELIIDDEVEDFDRRGVTSNFTSLRLFCDQAGSPFDVLAIGGVRQNSSLRVLGDGTDALESALRFVWIDGTGAGFAAPDESDPEQLTNVRLQLLDAPASPGSPLHIGGVAGIDPIDMIEDVYDGVYGGSQPVRYDRSATAALKGHFPKMHFRITESAMMDQWLEEVIFKPLGLIPTVNSFGLVVIRDFRAPLGLNPAAMFTFDATNLIEFPSWDHRPRDAVTAIVGKRDRVYQLTRFTDNEDKRSELDGDLLLLQEKTLKRTADTVDLLGEQVMDLNLNGYPFGGKFNVIDTLAEATFDRFGDGPIVGSMVALPSTANREQGEFAKINLASFPNPNETSGRGGERVVQLIRKVVRPGSVEWEYLDAGPSAQPLSTPTISIAQAGSNPAHTMTVTISSLDGNASRWELQVDRGDGWEFGGEGLAAVGTASVGNNPSGTSISARLRAFSRTRIASEWSSVVSASTASLSAPGAVTATVDGRNVGITWTNTETEYELMPTLDGADWISFPLRAGSTSFVFSAPGTGSKSYGVKYVDEYGGDSGITFDTVDANQALVALGSPDRLTVLQGGGGSAPISDTMGTGVELGWRATNAFALTRVQWSTDVAFSTISGTLTAAGNQAFVFLPMSETTWYFRIRAEKDGYADSAWSDIASAGTTYLIRSKEGADSFAGGYGQIYLEGGDVKISVGSSDPDTQKIFYSVVVPATENVFPAVDDTSNAVDRDVDVFPYQGAAVEDPPSVVEITAIAGQRVNATFRFQNRSGIFGQTTYDSFVVPAEAGSGGFSVSFVQWSTETTNLPEAVTGLSATEPAPPQNEVDVDWTDSISSGIIEYQIWRDDGTGNATTPGAYAALTDILPGVETYRDSDSGTLSGATFWWYRIRARTRYGWSDYVEDVVDLSTA